MYHVFKISNPLPTVHRNTVIAGATIDQFGFQDANRHVSYGLYFITGVALIILIIINALSQYHVTEIDSTQILQQARAGEPMAELQLALAYRDGGMGLRVDHRVAAEWFRQAALTGSYYAAAMLGDAYAVGDGVTQDENAAENWWKLSADHGNSYAQYKLGAAMVAGGKDLDPLALQARRDNGYRWLEQAALSGNTDAQRVLGVDLAFADYKTIIRLPFLSETAKIIDPLGSSDIKSLRRAALAGDSVAEYQLSMRYRDGSWGVEVDNKQAATWLELSASHGNALAMNTLATAYEKGALGLTPNAALATSWRLRAKHIIFH